MTRTSSPTWRGTDPKAIGARVKARRHELGLSQREVAFERCSYAYLSRIEAGTRTPSGHVLEELARRLGVSRLWLEQGSQSIEVVLPDVVARAIALDIAPRLQAAWEFRFAEDGVDLTCADHAVLPAIVHLFDDDDRDVALAIVGEEVMRDAVACS